MIDTVKGFSIVSEAEVDIFLEFRSFFYDPADVDKLISGSSTFSKSSLDLEVLSSCTLKTSLKDIEHYFASMQNECNCVVVWSFFGIALLLDWNENWPLVLIAYPTV